MPPTELQALKAAPADKGYKLTDSGGALLWHDLQTERRSPMQVNKVEQALRRDLLPAPGRLPLVDIDGALVLKVLRLVEARSAIDTVERLRQHVSAVIQFGMAESPARATRRRGLVKSLRRKPLSARRPAVRTLAGRALSTAMEASTSARSTKLAPRSLALTAVGPRGKPTARSRCAGRHPPAPGLTILNSFGGVAPIRFSTK